MDKKYTRRDFLVILQGLGLAALLPSGILAAAEARQYDIQSIRKQLVNRRNRAPKVLILGAGIAGLTAAYELNKAGYSYHVLEARPRPGGKCETIRAGTIVQEINQSQNCQFSVGRSSYFNPGPARISQLHYRLLDYCREFNVQLEPFINENRSALLQFNNGYAGKPITHRALHAAQRGHIASSLAHLVSKGAARDIIPVDLENDYLAMLVQFGDLGSDFLYQGSTRAGLANGSGETSPEQFAPPISINDFLKADPFTHFKFYQGEYLSQQASMLQPVGGMDRIADAFARRISPATTTYGAVIQSIKRSGASGVEVIFSKNGRQQKARADQVIISIPLPVLRNIDNDFPPDMKTAIASAYYTSSLKIAFEAKRFWEAESRIYGGVSWSEKDITQVWYPSAGFQEETGVLVGGYIFDGPAGDSFSAMPHLERERLALSQMELLHPNIRQSVLSSVSRAWKSTAYSLGGWSVTPPAAVLTDSRAPYIFAGDHTTYLSGWQEGAILSAHKALANI